MFAVIKTGGKQYKVEKGTILEVEKLTHKEGSTFTIDKVLLIADKSDLKVGTPLVEGAYVEAKVTGHRLGKKIRVFKMKAKKRYQKTNNHRPEITTIEIVDIKATGGKIATKSAEKAVEAEKTAPKAEKAPTKKPAAKKPAAKKAPAKKDSK